MTLDRPLCPDQHLPLPDKDSKCGTGFQLMSQVTLRNMAQ